MTPASKGAQVKRVPASRTSRSASTAPSRSGNKKSAAKVAATTARRPPLPKKKAVTVVKKAATATKKVATPAKKPASAAKKPKAAPAKKAASAPRKSAPAPTAKKAAAAKKGTSAAPAAATKKTAAKAATKTAPKKGGASGAGAVATPAAAELRTSFTPKPKPPAPVRPKTGPYAKDAKFLDEVRELLVADRAVYQEQATSLRAEADSLALEREPGDVQFDEESGEGDTLQVERERDLALSARARHEVEEIDRALQKITDGTYGICEVSGQPIPKARLQAIPQCRERVEYKVGGFNRH